MIQAPFLKKGSKVGIVAPAGKVDKKQVLLAAGIIEERGYNVVLGDSLFDVHFKYAGPDTNRIADVQQMFDDESLDAIFFARGGYGSVRVVPYLDFTTFLRKPKWVVGYSDITVFHAHLNRNLKTVSIHGTMPINYLTSGKDISFDLLIDLLTGEKLRYKGDGHAFNRMGNCSGKLVGGNLSMLYSLIGTDYNSIENNSILFIEDLGEHLYHVDRMMMNLKLGGKLENLSGLIVGGMNDMLDEPEPFGLNALEIIQEAVSSYQYPVLYNFQAGHMEPNLPLKLGAEVKLSIDKQGYTLIEM